MEPYAGSNAMLREANEQVVRAYINRVRQSSFTARVEEEIQMIIEQGGPPRLSQWPKSSIFPHELCSVAWRMRRSLSRNSLTGGGVSSPTIRSLTPK